MSPNRLADETSPYLRQHADNPVDWYPWGDDAFERARSEDKPIFLSIGYSACHWCHVMAHESFEDPITAEALNTSFVSIKVDREERPDVDAVYMEAVQSITGSGGWPMSVFSDPGPTAVLRGDLLSPGGPGRDAVVPDRAHRTRRCVGAAAGRGGDAGRRAGRCRPLPVGGPRPGRGNLAVRPGWCRLPMRHPRLLEAAVTELAARFDPEWGGFGGAPKFPQPTLVDVALCQARRRPGSPEGRNAAEMATLTLDAMAAGGIHDHLAGGFARYSTDGRWLVPHFEKMLYDQAGLLRAYLHGWQATGQDNYLRTMEGIVAYVGRYLTGASSGGVCSAEDADSEGVEGRFYVWTPAEIAAAVDAGVDPRDVSAGSLVADALMGFFGVTEEGNFEGSTILHRPVGRALMGNEAVEAGRAILAEARDHRVRPGLDDKVLTEWNAMYASALAEAAAGTRNPEWRDAAVAIGEFLVANLLGDDGRWRRSWQPDGGARHLAYAGDYAWVVDCFTRLGELTGEARWTQRAEAAADGLLDLFHDPEGGFFTTGHDARGPHRADQGDLRRGHPVGQRGGRPGPGPAGRADRGLPLHRGGPPGGGHVRRTAQPPSDRLRPHRADRIAVDGGVHRGGRGR